MLPFVFALPWLGLLLFVLFVARIPRALPREAPGAHGPGTDGRSTDGHGTDGHDVPMVSVIVPARNESVNIVGCLRSITRSSYPRFEVIVVDDRSTDRTAELARSVPQGAASRIAVIDGAPLPEGWLGKPWACHQGAGRARGDLLLFTDADTTHGSELLHRSVAAMEEDDADLLTVLGRQLMETFWERAVQPHIFLLMLIRFPDIERVARNDRWRDAIANGQFLLFRRPAYEAIGGHLAVRDEVAEDLALAQHVKRAGLSLRVRSTEHDLATRMYRSLGHLVEGWSKNIVMGGLQAFPPALRPVLPPVSFLGGVGTWLLAPTVLVLALAMRAGVGGAVAGALGAAGAAALLPAGLIVWAATVYALSAALWCRFTRQMGAPFWYGFLYPVGAAVGSYIFLRAWARGRTVEWKGRRYRLRPISERV